MSRYIINVGEELVFALKAASTCQSEQFVEYAANIDFWYNEFCAFKAKVDEYDQRLEHTGSVYAEIYPDGLHSTRDTSSPRERALVVREAREYLIKLINRGNELRWISVENYTYMVDQLDA